MANNYPKSICQENRGLCYFNFLHSHSFLPSSMSLKTNSHKTIEAVKNSHWRGQIGFGAPQTASSPEKCHYLTFGSSLEKPYLQGLSLFDLTQSLFSGKSPKPENLSKKKKYKKAKQISGNRSTSQLPEVVTPIGANKSLAKNLRRKIWGMWCPQGGLKTYNIFLGI